VQHSAELLTVGNKGTKLVLKCCVFLSAPYFFVLFLARCMYTGKNIDWYMFVCTMCRLLCFSVDGMVNIKGKNLHPYAYIDVALSCFEALTLQIRADYNILLF